MRKSKEEEKEDGSFEILDRLFYANAKIHLKKMSSIRLTHKNAKCIFYEHFMRCSTEIEFNKDMKKLKDTLKADHPNEKAKIFIGIDYVGHQWIFKLHQLYRENLLMFISSRKKIDDNGYAYRIFERYNSFKQKINTMDKADSLTLIAVDVTSLLDRRKVALCKANEDIYEALVRVDLNV